MSSHHKVYILVNSDLKMGKGKIGGQCGHAIQYLCDYYYNKNNQNTPNKYNYETWSETGARKIVCKATQAQIEAYIRNPEFISFPVYDAGLTQIASNSLTCIAFFPSNNHDDEFSQYHLL